MPEFSQRRAHINTLIAAANEAANPANCVHRHLSLTGNTLQIGDKTIPLTNELTNELTNGRIYLIAIGKAAVAMATAAATILGSHLHAGVSLSKVLDEPAQATLAKLGMTAVTGSHPIADQRSISATQTIIDLLSHTQPGDLVLCLISGGASALLTQPRISLDDWQALNRALLASGCTINDFNTVRRQLDQVKGGGLARLAAPARIASLILSDVISANSGNDLATIGSGPTVPTPDTAADARDILDHYALADRLDTAVSQRIHAALPTEQPPPPDNILTNTIIGDVGLAATAVAQSAADLGFTPQILTTHLSGEAREVAHVAVAIARDLPPNHCAILGGETTVTLPTDHGSGGRNQELALAAAIALDGIGNADIGNVAIATYATDGEDGPTNAAGALVSGETAVTARQHHLNPTAYLTRSDSHTFFQKFSTLTHSDGPIDPGPTGTNVNDLLILLKYGE